MPIQDKLNDLLHYDGVQEYSRTSGNVSYLDGSKLDRPRALPRAQRLFLYAIVAVAIIFGAIFLKDTVIVPIQSALTMDQAVKENVARQKSIERIPELASFINMDDDSIRAALENEGFAFYDASPMNDTGNMTLFVIPSDMTLDQAQSMYLHGINALNAADATKLLNGSFVLNVDRMNGTSMVIRYADFETGDPEAAVRSALASQGLTQDNVEDSGIDDSKNTYSSGKLDMGSDGQVSWKISAIELEDMYNISNLPENSCYVGIRLTK